MNLEKDQVVVRCDSLQQHSDVWVQQGRVGFNSCWNFSKKHDEAKKGKEVELVGKEAVRVLEHRNK